MKVCKKCGMPFDDSLTLCKKCKLELIDMPETYLSERDAKKTRRDWLWLIIGVPMFIVFMKMMYNILYNIKK